MKQIDNPILNEVYNYYDNKNNYLNESLLEDDGAIMIDDALFNDIMDMAQKGVFDKAEDGCILIPTKSNSTFIISPDGECYISDNLSSGEHEAQIDDAKLGQVMQAVQEPEQEYGMVSEKKSPIENIRQDGEFTVLSMKPGTTEKRGLQAAKEYNDEEAAKEAHKNRFNDPDYVEYLRDKRKKWVENPNTTNDPRQTRIPYEKYGEMNEEDGDSVYNLANDNRGNTEYQAANGAGYINKLDEKRLNRIVNRMIREQIDNSTENKLLNYFKHLDKEIAEKNESYPALLYKSALQGNNEAFSKLINMLSLYSTTSVDEIRRILSDVCAERKQNS